MHIIYSINIIIYFKPNCGIEMCHNTNIKKKRQPWNNGKIWCSLQINKVTNGMNSSLIKQRKKDKEWKDSKVKNS